MKKHLKKKNVSLRTHIFFVYFGAAVILAMSLMLFCHVLWNQAYISNSRREMRQIYYQLSALVADENTSEDDLKNTVIAFRDMQNVSFALEGDSEWEFTVITQQVVSDFELDYLKERLQADLLGAAQDEVRVMEEGKNYTIQFYEDGDTSHRYIECFGYMTDSSGREKPFIMSMPLENIFKAFSLSKVYFAYLVMILAIIGLAMMSFITFRITEPIYQLTDISQRMKQLDFSARYTGHSNDEIGHLGNNMNELSSQLERTILQLKLANEKLQKDLEEKNHQDEMRKDFISDVSHELKTPIALIQGYAEALKEFKDDPDNMDYYCDVIVDESDKMARMVKKLTTLNQLEFGRESIEEKPFDIMEMIRNLVNGSRKMQEEHSAHVTVNGPTSCVVLGDEYRIEEVVNNYYSNAFNHLEEPNEIRIDFVDLGPNVRISVRNTGKQIPEEELDKIWIKFYKVDKARTRAYGGSGIGLSIVKAIMDAHHEECGVYNVEDGVVFWFEIKKFGELVAVDGSDNGEVGNSTS